MSRRTVAPSPPQPPSKRGRKPILTADAKTLKQLIELARIQCTHAEAGAVLAVSRDTFELFLAANKSAMDAWEMGKEGGRKSLRRMQWKAAEKGNTAMMIWLGKQYLGQRDVQEYQGAGGGPFVVEIVRFGANK